MKRTLLLVIILFSIVNSPLSVFASPWEDANQLYADGNYADAAAAYEALIAESPSAEAYYNLGNAHFKSGEIASSILAYERALRIRPNYDDAKHNLQFAQSKIIDNIEDNHQFFLSQWAEAFRNLLSEALWFRCSVALFILFLLCALGFAFGNTLLLRKIAFHFAWIALLCSIISLSCAGSLHHRDKAREEAIIMQGIVNAKSSPDKSGTDLFVLHEGTKVRIKDSVNGWCEIHVGDNIGWVKHSALERI